jgi:hypothetical protein
VSSSSARPACMPMARRWITLVRDQFAIIAVITEAPPHEGEVRPAKDVKELAPVRNRAITRPLPMN